MSRPSVPSTTVGPMELDRDFSEFIACCVARDVRFLIVGGYALAAHGHPRFTKDLDVWVWLDAENAARLIAALNDFGFGSLGLDTVRLHRTLTWSCSSGTPPSGST